MGQIYGHRWESAYGVTGGPAFETWKAVLARYSAEQIGAALGRLTKAALPWPPTLPELLGFLKPNADEFGLPDLDAAFALANSGQHRANGLVFEVMSLIDAWDWRRMSLAERRRVFERNYHAAVAAYDPAIPYIVPDVQPLPEPARPAGPEGEIPPPSATQDERKV